MGRALWQTPPLTEARASNIEETCFDDGRFPPSEEIKAAFAAKRSTKVNLTQPFEGKKITLCALSCAEVWKESYNLDGATGE